jgi:hypothetical protein
MILFKEEKPYSWRPASGHPGGWRVVRKESGKCMEELEGPSGKLLLFKSMATAQARADKLNRATPDN